MMAGVEFGKRCWLSDFESVTLGYAEDVEWAIRNILVHSGLSITRLRFRGFFGL